MILTFAMCLACVALLFVWAKCETDFSKAWEDYSEIIERQDRQIADLRKQVINRDLLIASHLKDMESICNGESYQPGEVVDETA